MTLSHLTLLSKAEKQYYLFRFKGHNLGVLSGKALGIVIDKNRIDLNMMKHFSYKEISFMEYISLNSGYFSN